MKVVLKCITTIDGEQCVMTDSLTQQQELFVNLSVSGTFNDFDKCENVCPGAERDWQIFDNRFGGQCYLSIDDLFHVGGAELALGLKASENNITLLFGCYPPPPGWRHGDEWLPQ